MIGYLKGAVLTKEPPLLLLDVQGVGYELKVPMSGFYDIPEVGAPAQLFIHVVYREDAQNAYGFLKRRDRDFFRELIKVNGVGPNLALVILSGLTVDECIRAVQNNELASLTKLPGIGKRTAERLTLELKPKLQGWGVDPAQVLDGVLHGGQLADAQAALISLGYKAAEAKKALDTVAKQTGAQDFSSEDYIRTALRNLVKV